MPRIKRMTDRTIITLREWIEVHGLNSNTAKKWAARGEIPAYLSPPDNGVYLLKADTPVPEIPVGAASHRNNRRTIREAKLKKAGEI